MIDVAVIAIYLIGITAFGIWIGYRRNANSEQYFLAGHSLNWFTVGAAIFTSNISTIHLVGLAAGGAKEGIVIGNFEWMACFTLILLALIFAPFYINSGAKTLPEFMERRYCPSARTFLAVIGLLGALLIHIGISLFAAAKVFGSFLGVPMYATIIGRIYFVLDMPGIGKWLLHGRAHEGFGGLVIDPAQGLGVPFMLVGPVIAMLCVVIYLITSLLTPAMNAAEVAKVCWDHPLAFLKGRLIGLSDPRIVTLILLAEVGVLYYHLK